MFGKKSEKLETIIGAGSIIKGELQIKGTVRIDGTIEGDLSADWVIVGESGAILGNVKSKGVVVGGKIDGNIDADEIVELKSKAQAIGEISTGKIVMSEGASFDGQSRMKKNREEPERSEKPAGLLARFPTGT